MVTSFGKVMQGAGIFDSIKSAFVRPTLGSVLKNTISKAIPAVKNASQQILGNRFTDAVGRVAKSNTAKLVGKALLQGTTEALAAKAVNSILAPKDTEEKKDERDTVLSKLPTVVEGAALQSVEGQAGRGKGYKSGICSAKIKRKCCKKKSCKGGQRKKRTNF